MEYIKRKRKQVLLDENLKRLIALDQSKNHKYLDWLISKYEDEKVDIQELESFIPYFIEAIDKNLIKDDFIPLTYEKAKDLYEEKQSEKERKYTKGLKLDLDYQKIAQNNRYFVFSPLNQKAGIQLGKGSSWCTAREDDKNAFELYDLDDKTKIYYFIPLTGKEKYAIVVDSNGVVTEGRDVKNERMPYEDILKITKFDKSILKPWIYVPNVHFESTGDPKKDYVIAYVKLFELNEDKVNITDDYKVNYEGDVIVTDRHFEQFPIKFGRVTGDFNCAFSKQLKTLYGVPDYVGGDFVLNYCVNLENLKYSPETVGGSYFIEGCNSLVTLEGITQDIGGGFDCTNMDNLKSLEGLQPVFKGNFNCGGCHGLHNLKGAPREVYGYFECDYNKLETLVGCPEIVHGNFNCVECYFIDSLEGCPKVVKGNFNIPCCKRSFTKEEILQYCEVGGEFILQ